MKPAILICLALVALALPVDAGWFSRRTPTPTPTPLRKALPPPTPTPVPTPRPPPRELVALPIYDEETSVRLQIFSITMSSGRERSTARWASFSARRWSRTKRRTVCRRPGRSTGNCSRRCHEPYTIYTIRLEDEHFVGDVGLDAIAAGEIEGDEIRLAARVCRGALSRGGGFSAQTQSGHGSREAEAGRDGQSA